jgi:hypothetical protein
MLFWVFHSGGISRAPACVSSGRSAAWLARLVRDQEAGGSNPLAPTISSCLTPKFDPLRTIAFERFVLRSDELKVSTLSNGRNGQAAEKPNGKPINDNLKKASLLTRSVLKWYHSYALLY